ncbi:SDR family oxidoreductase [Pseudoduganella sp. UC29_106]|uniref:SDR family oxidoreductase n=1 Tax=Pseudoduganella sp. UC29_106 TaxID=3374553 RepID=UPI003756EF61
MKIKDSVVLVTGANRGLGLALAKAALAAGAKKVYGAARDASAVTLPGVTPVQLDVTNPASVAALARDLGDVSILVNNAGIATGSPVVGEGSIDKLRAEFETNVVGPMALSNAFAPILKQNGGGAIINILSALSWISLPSTGTYSTSKAAAWAVTNGLRGELAAQNTRVVGAHMGYMDTDMTAGIDAPKARPEDVARIIFEGLEAGEDEVLADDIARQVRMGLRAERGAYLGAPRS